MASLEKTILEIPISYATKNMVKYIELKLKKDLWDSSPWEDGGIYIFESGEVDTGDVEKKLMDNKIPYNRYNEFYDSDSCLWIYRPENGQTEFFYESDYSEQPKIRSIPLWHILNKDNPPEMVMEELKKHLNRTSPYFRPLKEYNKQ